MIFWALTFLTIIQQSNCQLLSRVKNPNVYLPREDSLSGDSKEDTILEHRGSGTPNNLQDAKIFEYSGTSYQKRYATKFKKDTEDEDYDIDKDPDPEYKVDDRFLAIPKDIYKPTLSWLTDNTTSRINEEAKFPPSTISLRKAMDVKEAKEVHYDYSEETGWPILTIKLVTTTKPIRTTSEKPWQDVTRTSSQWLIFPPRDRNKAMEFRPLFYTGIHTTAIPEYTLDLVPITMLREGTTAESTPDVHASGGLTKTTSTQHTESTSKLNASAGLTKTSTKHSDSSTKLHANAAHTDSIITESFNESITESDETKSASRYKTSLTSPPTDPDENDEIKHLTSTVRTTRILGFIAARRTPDRSTTPRKSPEPNDVNDERNWMCYTCGLNSSGYGHSACYRIFDGEEQRFRYIKEEYETKCDGETDKRYVGGCFKRYLDLGIEYIERGCRSWPPARGKSYLSDLFMHLEYLLKYQLEGCVASPHAVLVPFSESIHLYSRLHVCICQGPYCNTASSYRRYHYLSRFIPFILVLYNHN